MEKASSLCWMLSHSADTDTEFTLNLGASAVPAVSRVGALNWWTSIFRVDGDRYKVMLRLPL